VTAPSTDLASLADLRQYLRLPAAWVKSTVQALGDQVRANLAVYQCITAGTTASSGTGPSGTTADITDGSAHWKYLNPNLGADDPLLSRIISAVSLAFATYCDRTFASTSWTYQTSGKGGVALMLPEYPVTTITSVSIDGTTIPARQTVGGWGYVQSGPNKILIDGAGYPASFTHGVANVSVAFTAGYSSVPYDLAQACLETCGSWYRRSSRIDEDSKSVQGEVISFSRLEIPKAARFILEQYKRPWPRDGQLTVATP
jgi:hypothetical protein